MQRRVASKAPGSPAASSNPTNAGLSVSTSSTSIHRDGEPNPLASPSSPSSATAREFNRGITSARQRGTGGGWDESDTSAATSTGDHPYSPSRSRAAQNNNASYSPNQPTASGLGIPGMMGPPPTGSPTSNVYLPPPSQYSSNNLAPSPQLQPSLFPGSDNNLLPIHSPKMSPFYTPSSSPRPTFLPLGTRSGPPSPILPTTNPSGYLDAGGDGSPRSSNSFETHTSADDYYILDHHQGGSPRGRRGSPTIGGGHSPLGTPRGGILDGRGSPSPGRTNGNGYVQGAAEETDEDENDEAWRWRRKASDLNNEKDVVIHGWNRWKRLGWGRAFTASKKANASGVASPAGKKSPKKNGTTPTTPLSGLGFNVGKLNQNLKKLQKGKDEKGGSSFWRWRISLGKWGKGLKSWHIIAVLLTITMIAYTITNSIIWFLNPDKVALPWRDYCESPHPSYHHLDISGHLVEIEPPTSPDAPHHRLLPVPLYPPTADEVDNLSPVGIFLGVFSTAERFERRQLIRTTYAIHPLSRTRGTTERVRIRFILGLPKNRKLERSVALEMKTYGDIVVLPIKENMNSGKTHAFFSWASENATVPSPFGHSQHHNEHVWDDNHGRAETRPDFVAKADDDSFIMLGELERRLRPLGTEMVHWGYLVKNLFMGGEIYALSYDLVRFVTLYPGVKKAIHGAEDKLVAKWMRMHPEKEEILWVSERCWIYDHPKAGTVYSHGYLFPSTLNALQARDKTLDYDPAFSSVTKFGHPYSPPFRSLTTFEEIEALVEDSDLSKGAPPSELEPWPSRWDLYDNKRWGGTVVVHFIKTRSWFLETAYMLLSDTGASEPEAVDEHEDEEEEDEVNNEYQEEYREDDESRQEYIQ